MTRPVLVFDGSCGFCRKWIERWRGLSGESVHYMPASEAEALYPQISKEEFERAVQLIRPDGSRASGAAAVLEITAPHAITAQAGLALYKRSRLFAGISEGAYAFVARNRLLFSRLTALLWGASTQKPSFAVANGLFLRILAAIFLVALLSFRHQAAGLHGPDGILPVAPFFEAVGARFGPSAFWALPSLIWLSPTLETLLLLTDIGIAASLVALLGVVQPLCFLILWAVMLSLCTAGQDFYSFQWDALLIETGFLAVFMAPWRWKPNAGFSEPPRLARFAAVALLFRLIFCSGVVKLSSGDDTWRSLRALDFHFLTQPLPNPLAWFAHHLPVDVLTAACAILFVIELVLPFAFFLPRNPRLVAAWATIALQIGIALTGNFAFFNILTIALCLLLLDDRCWPGFLRQKGLRSVCVTPWIRVPVLVPLLVLSLVPLVASFRTMPPFLAPLAEAYSKVAPLRSLNGYGLFAVMTTQRREIIVQGSDDGHDWRTYEFRYKPGTLDRPLPIIAPYQPRLDWQMWFAALGRIETTPWFPNFLTRLLQGSPAVLALLEKNPFPENPPKFVRAVVDDYTFTTPAERSESGAWWKREPVSIYCPEASLNASNRDF